MTSSSERGFTFTGWCAPLALAWGLAAVPASVSAEVDFSGQTIEVIVPFGAGGGTDTYTRLVTPFLERYLPGNPSVIVRNVPGGGSVIGANRFQDRARPDGRTVLALSTSTIAAYVLNLPEVRFELEGLIPVIAAPSGIVTYASSDTGVTGEDLAADVEALKGNNLVFGGQSATSSEMASLLAFHMLGLEDITTVFGLSRGEVRQAFERGEVNINYDSGTAYLSATQQLVDSGQAVPLFAFGFATEDGEVVRDPTVPDLPTFVEFYEAVHGEMPSGPDFQAWYWALSVNVMASKSLQLPPGTPDEIVEAYHEAAEAMLADPEYQERAQAILGADPQVIGYESRRSLETAISMDPEASEFLTEWLRSVHDVVITMR